MDSLSKKLRYFSKTIAAILNRFGISPNVITGIRIVIFGSGSVIFFLMGGYFYNFLGLIFLGINHFFDLVDGDLARNFNKKTELGTFLDSVSDAIVVNFVTLAIVINLFLIDSPFKYFGLFALSGQTLSNKLSQIYKTTFGTSSTKIDYSALKKIGWNSTSDKFSVFILELLTPRHIITSLFSTLRYYLLIGVLLNVLPIAIAIYSLIVNLRWICLFVFLTLYYSESKVRLDGRVELFKIFREIERKRK